MILFFVLIMGNLLAFSLCTDVFSGSCCERRICDPLFVLSLWLCCWGDVLCGGTSVAPGCLRGRPLFCFPLFSCLLNARGFLMLCV